MIDATVVSAALKALQVEFMRSSNQFRRDGDGMMAELYKSDAADVDSIKSLYETVGDFDRMISSVMSLDTVVRERVLEALAAAVGKEAIEATGMVRFF